MKYTRRSMIKKAGFAGLLLFIPGIVKSALVSTGLAKNELRENLEQWEVDLKEKNLMADVIIINNISVCEFDMVALCYDSEKSNAPVVLFSKDNIREPQNKFELKSFIKEIERFADRNNVYISYFLDKFNQTGFIKDIKKCGMYNEISEDLYRSVSFVYAEKDANCEQRDPLERLRARCTAG